MKNTLLVIFLLLGFKQMMGNPADSTYAKDPYFLKLVKTNSQVPIFYNEQVRKQIQFYLRNINNSTSILIGKTQYYNNLLSHYFDTAGVPKQLFLLSSAISNCDPLYSDADGGSGMWVLSYAIAKKYLLSTNSYIDERRDPYIGTQTAANYFKDLNFIYQDWLKTLVAFRAGPINMNMAIHKANNSLDYGKIHNMLNETYQSAAVNYMAFWYIWNYYSDHKLIPVKYKLQETDTVQVQREISFNAIAFNLNISEDILRQNNAELRLDIIPTSYNNKGLRLPKDKIADYHDKLNILFPPAIASNDSNFTDSLIMDDQGIYPRIVRHTDTLRDEEEEDESPKAPKKESKTVTIIYVVKSGDGLLLIADLFDCRVSDIKKWNGMRKDAIFKGQKLKIKVPKSKVSYYKKINTMS
ncbi:MAG: LysM peptidoglycan-binding domain-containing protein, partial [Bacteroidia bacterium]|nr:LysM peptidoglycan-binding domain-containing protein [Bacteroidia bacterium]